jgi:hypothetical protein
MDLEATFYLAWAKTFSAHAPGSWEDRWFPLCFGAGFIPVIHGSSFPVWTGSTPWKGKTIPSTNQRIQMYAMIRAYDPFQ